MKFLTTDFIKLHSRIDYGDEDELLEIYGDSAETTVLNYLNRTYEDLIEAYGDVPAPIKHAALMLVDTWYQYRCPPIQTSVSMVPYTFDVLIKPYMKL